MGYLMSVPSAAATITCMVTWDYNMSQVLVDHEVYHHLLLSTLLCHTPLCYFHHLCLWY